MYLHHMGKTIEVCVAAVLLASGCITQIRRVDPDWDHASDPACTDEYGPVVGDAVIGAALFGGGLIAADQIGDRKTAVGVALGGGSLGLLFVALAYLGYDRVEDCQRAIEAWRTAQAMAQRVDAERRTLEEQFGKGPRGWFCATSMLGAGLCARERSTCEQARDAAIGAGAELAACALVETAWCFAAGAKQRCFPTQGGCETQRGRVDGAAATCDERR